jgi:hypothetical protein
LATIKNLNCLTYIDNLIPIIVHGMNNITGGRQLGANLGGCLWALYPQRIDIIKNGVGGNRGSPHFTWPSDRA